MWIYYNITHLTIGPYEINNWRAEAIKQIDRHLLIYIFYCDIAFYLANYQVL